MKKQQPCYYLYRCSEFARERRIAIYKSDQQPPHVFWFMWTLSTVFTSLTTCHFYMWWQVSNLVFYAHCGIQGEMWWQGIIQEVFPKLMNFRPLGVLPVRSPPRCLTSSSTYLSSTPNLFNYLSLPRQSLLHICAGRRKCSK